MICFHIHMLKEIYNMGTMAKSWGVAGPTLCHPPGDTAKAALEWNPQGTRSRGRPRTTRRRRTIFEEIRHQGKTWNKVNVLASNRVRWWNFVKALCSLEEWRETIYIYIKLRPNQSFLEIMTANISIKKMPHITGRDDRSSHNYKNVDAASTFFNTARNLGLNTITSSK